MKRATPPAKAVIAAFLIALIFCCGNAVSQEPQKVLEDIAGRIHERKANPDDLQKCRELYALAQDDANKRASLYYAAKYHRRITKSPLPMLELLAPSMIGKDEYASWKASNRNALRDFASGKENSGYTLSNMPGAENCPVAGSFGPLAIEFAYALFACRNESQALEIIDAVGNANTDEARVLALECLGDYYSRNREYSKARDAFSHGNRIIRGIRGGDYYYDKGDRVFSNRERDIIAQRISRRLKDVEELEDGKKIADIEQPFKIDFRSWRIAQPIVESLEIRAQFIICMIPDGSGGAFVGTEDHGVYHYDNSGAVKQYKDELGDPNAYALAVDKLGRLWVGHLNTGVSVFNGKEWKNYDVIDGPIGERVFDIQTCPFDGDVWIATSAGISRYKIETDAWEHYTREDGLLEDQASSLAFKEDGTLIIGTQCHGVALFNRDKDGNYKHAKNITAPERFGPKNCSPVPLEPFGNGLPTNQINQIIVSQTGDVWIATPTGLVKSNNNLTKMNYVRGRDYADKVRGLYGGAPQGWKECPKEVKDDLLPEDYITCINEDETGTIWIGTRQRGFMAIDPKTGKRGTGDRGSMGMADNYVSSILPMRNDKPLIGLYIGGVIRPKEKLTLQEETSSKKPARNSKSPRTPNQIAQRNYAKLPSPIAPPSIEELKAMQKKLESLTKPLPKTYATYYGEDWKTQGDWIGRYGRQWATLCATNSPWDHQLRRVPATKVFKQHKFIGPHCAEGDGIRHWVHWLKTDDQRALYNPWIGFRRQAEWDDHAEVYPMAHDGPHLWVLFEVAHKGVYTVNMYFFNKDGHDGNNRIRDYLIKIYQTNDSRTPFSSKEQDGKKMWQAYKKYEESHLKLFPESAFRHETQKKPLAVARVKDFWGGVHKQFVLTGPGKYYVKVDKNGSFNTILSMFAVDRLIGPKINTEEQGLAMMQGMHFPPPEIPEGVKDTLSLEAIDLWNKYEGSYLKLGNFERQRRARISAYQAAHSNRNFAEPEAKLALSLKWRLNQWDEAIRTHHHTKVKEAWDYFAKRNPDYVRQLSIPRDPVTRKVPGETGIVIRN